MVQRLLLTADPHHREEAVTAGGDTCGLRATQHRTSVMNVSTIILHGLLSTSEMLFMFIFSEMIFVVSKLMFDKLTRQ